MLQKVITEMQLMQLISSNWNSKKTRQITAAALEPEMTSKAVPKTTWMMEFRFELILHCFATKVTFSQLWRLKPNNFEFSINVHHKVGTRHLFSYL
jgi:hypothetical protein